MITMKCLIHDAEFGCPEPAPATYSNECPFCLRDEVNALRKEVERIAEQRDTLLAAITIKRTVRAHGIDATSSS